MARQRTGCWICWKRKLKCDSLAPDNCANCKKRGVECRYEDPKGNQELQGRVVPSQHITEAGIRRDRAQRACTNCAHHKLKCSGNLDGCQRCEQNKLVCLYPSSKRASRLSGSETPHQHPRRRTKQPRDPVSRPSISSSDQTSRETPSTEPSNSESLYPGLSCKSTLIRQYVDAYFNYVYPVIMHGFLHQGTFLEGLDRELVPVVLLQAVILSASWFVSLPTEVTIPVTSWEEDVDAYIMSNMGTFSVLNLKVVILWANYHHFQANLGKAWMLHSLAVRLAYTLQIHIEPRTGTPSDLECRRRMMWNLRIMDRHLAGTIEEFSLCSKFLDHLMLPCEEHFYLADIRVETDTLQKFDDSPHLPNIGAFAGYVCLFEIWHEILMFMRNLSRNVTTEEVKRQVSCLVQKLANFEERLPVNLRFTDRNMYLQPTISQKISFIMLKAWWQECYCDIFRFSLPGFRESLQPTPERAVYLKECQHHVIRMAVTQSTFLKRAKRMGNVLVSDPSTVTLIHSNTRTLLAIRKLRGSDLLDDDSVTTEQTTGISDLLESNVSFLDELGRKVPRVAVAQREIRYIIQRDASKSSAEEVINRGLPLKRRHSRVDLLNPEEPPEQSISGISTALRVVSSFEEDGSTAPAPHTYLPTALTPNGFSLESPTESQDNEGRVGMEVWAWNDEPWNQGIDSQDGMSSYLPDLGLYETSIIGGLIGLSTPFGTGLHDSL